VAKGKVYIVGAGPGRPDLISVRGLKILKQAEVIIYDYLVDKSLLADLSPGVELVCADTLGKKRLIKKALAGKKVVRLKNGDATIFSRLSQELKVLQKHKIAFEIVPGITAASAAAAYTGIPLTDRNFSHNVVFVTGHDPAADWNKIAALDTIVLYMAMANLKEITLKLIAAGKAPETPALIISSVGAIKQKMVKTTLATIASQAARAKVIAPAIIVIGEVVGFEKDFNWLRQNKRVLFTGLSEERYFLDGIYFHLPLIKIVPLKNYQRFDVKIKNIADYGWLVFASRYGVEYFFKRLFAIGLDTRSLATIKIAATGQSTSQRLLDYGVRVDLVPRLESSDGLVVALKKEKINKQLVFMPRSNLADKGLKQKLGQLGAQVISCLAYNNVMPDNLPDIDLSFFNEIMFTSPSTVRNFKKRYGRPPANVELVSIGKTTQAAVREVFGR